MDDPLANKGIFWDGANVMPYISEGAIEETDVGTLFRQAGMLFWRGQVSNALVALDLYQTEKDRQRARMYAERFLSMLAREESTAMLKGLFEGSEKVRLPAEIDKRLPEVGAALETVKIGEPLNKKKVSETKAFLAELDETLTTLAQEQEGPPLEPWRFGLW